MIRMNARSLKDSPLPEVYLLISAAPVSRYNHRDSTEKPSIGK